MGGWHRDDINAYNIIIETIDLSILSEAPVAGPIRPGLEECQNTVSLSSRGSDCTVLHKVPSLGGTRTNPIVSPILACNHLERRHGVLMWRPCSGDMSIRLTVPFDCMTEMQGGMFPGTRAGKRDTFT